MLLRGAVAMRAGSGIKALGPTIWADLGCGDGTFIIALADLVAAGSTIHAGEPEQFSSPFRARGLSVHHVPARVLQPTAARHLYAALSARSNPERN